MRQLFLSTGPKETGRKYWVEAKMRSVVGLLGKTIADGTSDANPISRLIPHLNSALAKPAADERLIFIDLNTEPDRGATGKPIWMDRAVERLEQYETNEMTVGSRAYLFMTNVACHRDLDGVPAMSVVPYGLGMANFNRPGFVRLIDAYRQKERHIDAYRICESFVKYAQFPQTFDGGLPSESFGRPARRILIGETYLFDDGKGGQILGTVTTAAVNEPESKVYFGVTDQHGQASILCEPMTTDQLAEYRANRDVYFGANLPVGGKVTTKFALFEWLMKTHKNMPRENILSHLANVTDRETLERLSDNDLCATYCEAVVGRLELSGFKFPDELSP